MSDDAWVRLTVGGALDEDELLSLADAIEADFSEVEWEHGDASVEDALRVVAAKGNEPFSIAGLVSSGDTSSIQDVMDALGLEWRASNDSKFDIEPEIVVRLRNPTGPLSERFPAMNGCRVAVTIEDAEAALNCGLDLKGLINLMKRIQDEPIAALSFKPKET